MSHNQIITYLFKHKPWIYIGLGLPVAAGVIYKLIAYLIYPLPNLSWSKLHLFVIPFIELLALFFFLDLYHRFNGREKTIHRWRLAFWFALLNLIAVYMLAAFYGVPGRAQYLTVRLVSSFVPALKCFLICVTLFFFWRGYRNWLISDTSIISFENLKPLGRKRISMVILCACFVLGLALRIYNLDGFPPYVDEYIHTHDAVTITQAVPYDWGRAFLIVSFPVYLSYQLFGISLWASRFPMILINMLALFPLYALGKKINQQVGYICVALYVLSPWIIGASRTVRDYAVIPLFFYLAANALVDLLDWDNLTVTHYIKKHYYQVVIAALILVYALYDRLSILKIIVSLYGIFGLLAVLKIWKQNPPLKKKLIVLGLGGAMLILMIIRSGLIGRYLRTGTFFYHQASTYWFSLVESQIHQWYFVSQLGYGILLIGSLLVIRVILKGYSKSGFVFLLCFLTFITHLAYLTYFLMNPRLFERIRYGVLMEYWYLLVVAMFLWIVYHLLRRVMRRVHPVFLIMVMLGLFINFPALRMVLTYSGGGVLAITGEMHYLVAPGYEFLAGRLTDKDVLLSDVLNRYDEIADRQFDQRKIINFLYLIYAQKSEPLAVIRTYPQGWIALSENVQPGDFNLKFADFTYDGKLVRYYGELGEIYIWQWGKIPPP